MSCVQTINTLECMCVYVHECSYTHTNKTKQKPTMKTQQNKTLSISSVCRPKWELGTKRIRIYTDSCTHMWGGRAHTHCQSPSVIYLPTVPGGKKREIQLSLSATCLGSSWDRLKPQGYNSSFALYLPMNLRVETFLFLLPGIFRQKKTTPDKSTGSSLPSLLPSLLLLFL